MLTAGLWTTTAPAATAVLSVRAGRSRPAPVQACSALWLAVSTKSPAVSKDSAWQRPRRRTDPGVGPSSGYRAVVDVKISDRIRVRYGMKESGLVPPIARPSDPGPRPRWLDPVVGVRLGESGEQTIAQIRRRNWGGWVQDGAVQSHLPRMRSWLSESGGLALYPKSAAQYNRACLTSGTRISCVRACLSILRGRFPAWASA
jgi:hypothetical protein